MQHKTKRYTPVYVSFCAREKNKLCKNCDKTTEMRRILNKQQSAALLCFR